VVGQRTTILIGEMIKYKILRNDWKKDLLVVDMVIIKHILEWRKFMRWTCDLQEGPHAWCNSSGRGARVELLLEVGESHLYLLVKFHDLIYITDVKCELLNVYVFKGKGYYVNCQVMKLSLTKKIWEVWFEA